MSQYRVIKCHSHCYWRAAFYSVEGDIDSCLVTIPANALRDSKIKEISILRKVKQFCEGALATQEFQNEPSHMKEISRPDRSNSDKKWLFPTRRGEVLFLAARKDWTENPTPNR
jgi:hypothetical protein